MKKISILTGCFNEEMNVAELCRQVKAVFAELGQYDYEHVFIDNHSQDRTVSILREIARQDPHVKVIVNARNFGQVRSVFYGLLQTKGDATILMVADLQDPPAMIKEFLKKWEEGYKLVAGVKKGSHDSPLMFVVRKLFYYVMGHLSEVEQIKNFTGFGLYDKKVVDLLRTMDDAYPYLRGMICEIGYDIARVEYVQPVRKRGKTSHTFYSLYDMAMLGITNHSKVPLRLATMLGFLISLLSILTAFGYLIAKLIFWDNFTVGIAPLVISLFFFSSVQLFFIGILGEYIGSIHTQVLKRPLVIEAERINFDDKGIFD